jgi:hypothetical protein
MKKKLILFYFFSKTARVRLFLRKMLTKTATSEQFSRISLKMANFRISFLAISMYCRLLFCFVRYIFQWVVVCCCLSFVGRRMLMAECLVSLSVVVAGSWLSGVGCRWLSPGCRVLVVGCWLSVVVTGSWVPGLGCRWLLLGPGCQVLVFGGCSWVLGVG